MRKHVRSLSGSLAAGVVLVVGAAAGADEFDDAQLFLEFNSTDNDLGVQVFLDGDAWRKLTIEGPDGKILTVTAGGSLKELGLTELFFESDEPSPDEVLGLFPEGEYRFEGRTVDGEKLEGTATLSHALPDPPVITSPANDGDSVDPDNATITWTQPNPDELESIQVIIENQTTEVEVMTVLLAPDATSLGVPPEVLAGPGDDYKVEVLAISENANKTITERPFTTQ